MPAALLWSRQSRKLNPEKVKWQGRIAAKWRNQDGWSLGWGSFHCTTLYITSKTTWKEQSTWGSVYNTSHQQQEYKMKAKAVSPKYGLHWGLGYSTWITILMQRSKIDDLVGFCTLCVFWSALCIISLASEALSISRPDLSHTLVRAPDTQSQAHFPSDNDFTSVPDKEPLDSWR